MSYHRPRLISALALLALAVPLRADPVAWSYSWSPTSGTIQADSPGTGTVSLSGEAVTNAFGNSFIVATNIVANSVASANSPDQLTTNGGYQLNLTLKDTLSGASTTLSFSGKLSGTFSSSSANITNAFLSPTTQAVNLGDNLYSVTLDSYVPPGPAGATLPGAIDAYVTVTASDGPIHPTSVGTPEPSSLLLCGMGVAGCILAGWRRRRVGRNRRWLFNV